MYPTIYNKRIPKTFQILKHFDTHDSIDGINEQELIDLYYNDQNGINSLIHDRHRFRIAHSLCNKKTLTDQQQTFKNMANEQTRNQIRGTLLNMIHTFKSTKYQHLFKQLPGINTATLYSTNGSACLSKTFPFIMNFGFLTTKETQSARRICRSLNNTLDQKVAYQNYNPPKPSLDYIEQILNA